MKQTKEWSAGMGALIEFSNSEIQIRLVNDKGIIDLSICSVGSEDFHDSQLIFNMIELNRLQTENKKERKRILSTVRGVKEQMILLEEQYAYLTKLFSKSNYSKTSEQIEAIGEERMEYQFGKNWKYEG
ncbi:MAG: hypothetical protein ACFHWX_05830 [Bacteroidota bacterium]